VLISCFYWLFRHLLGLAVLRCRSEAANEVELLVLRTSSRCFAGRWSGRVAVQPIGCFWPVGCTNSILLQISTSGVATELMHPTTPQAKIAAHIDLDKLRPRIVNPFDSMGNFRPLEEIVEELLR
jgi:hypothetical protein